GGSGVVRPGEYRYDDSDSARIHEEIEIKKQELKELEELKEKEKTQSPSGNTESIDSHDEDEAMASSPTAVFSLIRTYF
ncbi:MAG TPA: hypothetical protein VFO37_15675, partial [Chitinophagaceae bacterium]|nr:hypothetical protein [Chitinophagaceae bacterium]